MRAWNRAKLLWGYLLRSRAPKGLPVEYVAFPHEQHGFRRAETIARALEAELAFYTRVFRLHG